MTCWYTLGSAQVVVDSTRPQIFHKPLDTLAPSPKVLSVNSNPFNPLMDYQPRENVWKTGNQTSVSFFYNDSLAVPFFRPVIFVNRNKPKLASRSVGYYPKDIALNFIPVNDTIIGYWDKTNKIGLDFSQIAFVNWNAGGDNSISGLIKANFTRKYTKGRLAWESELVIRYGLNQQEGRESRKTDDVWQLNSTIGYKTSNISDWNYTAKFSFNTQFTDGFAYPNIELPISRFFAPAYLFVGVGSEYSDVLRGFTSYFSPLTLKSTFVNDPVLANQGAFGVEKAVYDAAGNLLMAGKRSRSEVGILVTNQWKKEIFKNILLDHRLSLYTDYINNFGNIDIDWQLQLDMKINQYVRANIGTHIIYDDDIKNKRQVDGKQIIEGPRFQIKQLLGVGLVYVF